MRPQIDLVLFAPKIRFSKGFMRSIAGGRRHVIYLAYHSPYGIAGNPTFTLHLILGPYLSGDHAVPHFDRSLLPSPFSLLLSPPPKAIDEFLINIPRRDDLHSVNPEIIFYLLSSLAPSRQLAKPSLLRYH